MEWKSELKNQIVTAEQLKDILKISDDDLHSYEKIIERYPMRITPYYLSLVDKEAADDPIARMCIPSLEELKSGGSFDTSGEADNTKLDGVQHKYRQTVLLLSTNRCAMYCRYCFRKRMVGYSEDELNRRVDEVVNYVNLHKEINNVLISGGDALMNPNAIIKRYLKELSEIEHLDFIRLGSRIPVVLPQRIYEDEELLALFEKYAKKIRIYLVTQFNHPRELTDKARKAVQCLLDRNVQVRNQTVLLRGVNDSVETLAELLSGLTKMGVYPYYIFQCRPVTGVKSRFQVPIKEGIRIVDAVKACQNGFGKSVRYAMSHPTGKIEIVGELSDGQVIFKYHQNKHESDTARIFTRQLSEAETWLDEGLRGMI